MRRLDSASAAIADGVTDCKNETQRVAAALRSLPPDAAEELAETTLHDLREGVPVPPFFSLRDEARNWASLASPGELKAYLSAIWGRLPEAERQGFLRAVRPKRRAA